MIIKDKVKCNFCGEELLKSRAVMFYHIPKQKEDWACPSCDEKYIEVREIRGEEIKSF